jgi:hypothetical protein
MPEKAMAEKTRADQKKQLDEDAEQTAADVEPMGSVAAAVPRDAGSATSQDAGTDCDENSAPAHEGGHATLVAGEEAHKAENPPSRGLPAGKKPSA